MHYNAQLTTLVSGALSGLTALTGLFDICIRTLINADWRAEASELIP